MSRKLKLSPFAIYFIVLMITVYAIWFIFCQDVISTFGGAHKSPATGWAGILVLPFIVVFAIMVITFLILLLREKIKAKKKLN